MEAGGQERDSGEQPGVPQRWAHLAVLRDQRRRGLALGRGHPFTPHIRQHQPQAAAQALPWLRYDAVLRIHDILVRTRNRGFMPVLWLSNPDPDLNFSAYYFLKVHLHHFSKIKSKKEEKNSRNEGFSYCFSLMIELRRIRIRIRTSD